MFRNRFRGRAGEQLEDRSHSSLLTLDSVPGRCETPVAPGAGTRSSTSLAHPGSLSGNPIGLMEREMDPHALSSAVGASNVGSLEVGEHQMWSGSAREAAVIIN